MASHSQHDEEVKSKYFLSLDGVGRNRYNEKLQIDGYSLPDPYDIGFKGWEDNMKKWPSIEYADIYTYLIETPGVYTREALKARKSLDGYNYFISGHVQTCFYNQIAQDCSVCFIKAKVMPSQRVNDKPHEPWVCVDKTQGYVVTAHCTCKAGLGEACSHIAAILFKVMKAGDLGLNVECSTSGACNWNRLYRAKVQPKRVSEIIFTKNKQKRKERKTCLSLSDDEDDFDEVEALRNLKRVCPTAGILTKDDSDTDSASDDEDLPPLLNRFHETEFKDLSTNELKEKCERFVRDFSTSEHQAANLEKMTRAQHNSPIWQRQRQGRITATIAHDILSLRPNTSRENILKQVMKYTYTDLSNIQAIKFGRKFEKTARELYVTEMSANHEQFQFSECGLFVDCAFPLFAATPDGVRKCKCHGEGLLEIKCSYKHKDSHIGDIDDPNFYLTNDLHLKKSHRYYTQAQFQMFVCGKQFCDFVVYTHKGIVCKTVHYDADFVNSLIAKCTTFALDDLVPEIIQHKLKV